MPNTGAGVGPTSSQSLVQIPEFHNKLQTATNPEFTMKISTKNTMEISRFPVITDLCMSQFSNHFDSISLYVFQEPLRLFFFEN